MTKPKDGAEASYATHFVEPDPAPAEVVPDFVVLLDDYGDHRAGRILKANAELIADLATKQVQWREASARDLGLQGLA